MGAKRSVSVIVAPASAEAKVIVTTPEPVALLAASKASRSEMPSAPGLAISAQGLDVSPLITSSLVETTKPGQACCAAARCATSVAITQTIIAIVRTVCPPSNGSSCSA